MKHSSRIIFLLMIFILTVDPTLSRNLRIESTDDEYFDQTEQPSNIAQLPDVGNIVQFDVSDSKDVKTNLSAGEKTFYEAPDPFSSIEVESAEEEHPDILEQSSKVAGIVNFEDADLNQVEKTLRALGDKNKGHQNPWKNLVVYCGIAPGTADPLLRHVSCYKNESLSGFPVATYKSMCYRTGAGVDISYTCISIFTFSKGTITLQHLHPTTVTPGLNFWLAITGGTGGYTGATGSAKVFVLDNNVNRFMLHFMCPY